MSDQTAAETTQVTTATPETAAATPTPPATPDPAAIASPPAPPSLLDEPKAPAEAPEPFDAEKLTLPETFDRTTPAFTEFTELAKEAGINGAQAQKLVDFHLKHTQAAAEGQMAQWQATQDGWIGEVKADKEIGNIDALRQTISKVADNAELTDSGFKEALAFTGAGNNPAILRTLFRWAKALGEGTAVTGGVPARGANGALTNSGTINPADALYGPGGPHQGGPRLS